MNPSFKTSFAKTYVELAEALQINTALTKENEVLKQKNDKLQLQKSSIIKTYDEYISEITKIFNNQIKKAEDIAARAEANRNFLEKNIKERLTYLDKYEKLLDEKDTEVAQLTSANILLSNENNLLRAELMTVRHQQQIQIDHLQQNIYQLQRRLIQNPKQ